MLGSGMTKVYWPGDFMSTQLRALEKRGTPNPTGGNCGHKIKKGKDGGVRAESPRIRCGDREPVKGRPNPPGATGECDRYMIPEEGRQETGRHYWSAAKCLERSLTAFTWSYSRVTGKWE